jgi:hypothetical protein
VMKSIDRYYLSTNIEIARLTVELSRRSPCRTLDFIS